MEKQSNLNRTEHNDKKTLYETYTDYIDPSSITVNHYLSQNFYPGQEDHLNKIKQWVDAQTQLNKPLVFKTSPGVGVKTILSKWFQQTIKQNAGKKYKILPIIHFASNGGNSSNYFYCLYRIVIKLRQALKIKQGVDLLEEKIRKYFAYWMDICSTQIQKQQVVLSTQDIYSKIVIVIEGVDKFIDQQTGKYANISFWLPEVFPKNIKMICTVGEDSESLQYFQKKRCTIQTIYTSQNLVNHLLSNSFNRKTILNQQFEMQLKNILIKTSEKINKNSDIYKFIQIFSQFLLVENGNIKNPKIVQFIKDTIKNKVNLTTLQKITSTQILYDLIINMYSEVVPFKKKLSQILMYFALSQKGITIKQINQLTRFTQQEWALFKTIFSPVLIQHQTIYSIKCSSFIQSIIKKDRGNDNKQNKQTYLVKYHQKIAQALQNTPNSIRKLEEETYHLFVSKSYFKLKEIVSSIENFLLMFNPNNKYQLSRYWQKLEQKGFDPVMQYNKAIEGFSMHYHPSDENLFKIIVQISRFLKQFSDFQTYQTPAFRHPLIQGNMIQLQKIGLLEQFTQLQIYVDNSFSQIQEPENIPFCSLEQQIRQVRQQHFPKQKIDEQPNQKNIGGNKETAENQIIIQLQRNNKKIKKKINTQILSQMQQLNVDVPMNRDKFRNYYLNSLQQYIKGDDYNMSKQQDGYFQVQYDNIICDSIKIFKNKDQFSVNKIKQNYRMRHIKPSLYYYKRWVWIQFPWICISLNNNYSNAPEFCKHLEGQEMNSYEQQGKYTKQALIVAIQAKQKKKMMFTKKSDLCTEFSSGACWGRCRNPNLSGTKFSATRNIEKSSARLKLEQKNFTNIDLTLNALTKQFQARKKIIPVDLKTQDKNSSKGIFISQINDNCQQDMKFLNERKQFQAPDTQGLPCNQVLPRLKWTIKNHTDYQVNYIKSHIQQKRKKLNKIIFQNKKLAEVYKQLKLKQNLSRKNINEKQIDKHSRKLKMLENYCKKKQEVVNQFCKSLLQKQRLKIILKLCAENKTRNQEYLACLNYFLQNLKKMIYWQKNNIKSVTNQMNGIKTMKQKKSVLQAQKDRNAKIVRNEAINYLQQKQKLQQQIQNISIVIVQDLKDQNDKLQNSLQGHLKNSQQKNMLIMQQRKTKQLEEKLKQLQQQYESLKQLFEINGSDFENSPKFQHLLQQNEKNQKLKIIYFQRKNILEQAEQKLQMAKQQYQKSKNQNKNKNQKQPKSNNFKTLKQNLATKQSYSNLKNINNFKIILSNIALNLGVKTSQEIVPFLKEKLTQLKMANPIKYQQIMSNSKGNAYAQ